MADKVTSADVARRAGVSRSAVSRVFTPGASVSAGTAEKVRQAAADLGYRPNVLARSLLTGKSRIIGLVVGYLDNQFYPTAIERLSAALQERGYHVLMFLASSNSKNAHHVASDILDYQVDGLVLASIALTSDIAARCKDTGVPVVHFNRRQGDSGECAVVSDNFEGGRLAAQHLLQRGAQRLGYIAGWEGASTQREREAGFMEGLRAGGSGLYAREVGDFQDAATEAATRRMFDRTDPPDAVFVCNDHMALRVMDVLRYELGLRVPDDVAVVGFDDVPAAAWPAYGLTTVAQNTDQMVAETVNRLLAMIDLDGVQETVQVPVHLRVRHSA